MVSIVMPAYNAAKYLNESVESVVHQTYGDWELLILDDASEDGTAQMATEGNGRDLDRRPDFVNLTGAFQQYG